MSLLDNLDGKLEEENEFVNKTDESTKERLKILDGIFWKWFKQIGNLSNANSEDQFNRAKLYLQDIKITDTDISEFVLSLTKYENEPTFCNSGLFVSSMIQKSFDQGFNDFYVPALKSDTVLFYLMSHVEGNSKKKIFSRINAENNHLYYCANYSSNLYLTIDGNTGLHTGSNSNDSVIIVNGGVGKFGFSGIKSSYCIVNGKSQESCGWEAKDSTLIFNGTHDGYFYHAARCDVFVNGDLHDDFGGFTENINFYSKEVDKLEHTHRRANESCKYFLINKDDSFREVTFK